MNWDKTIKRTIIVCATYLFITICFHHLDKYMPWWILIPCLLLVPITFVAMLVYFVNGIIRIIRNRKALNFKLALPTIIVTFTLVYTLLSPLRLDSEALESKVEMKACYEGTQNQSTIMFRADKSFEVHSTGVFFSDYWHLGEWKKSGDTIFMKFHKEPSRLLGDTVIIYKDEYLIPLSQLILPDSLRQFHRFYYLGDCRHEN